MDWLTESRYLPWPRPGPRRRGCWLRHLSTAPWPRPGPGYWLRHLSTASGNSPSSAASCSDHLPGCSLSLMSRRPCRSSRVCTGVGYLTSPHPHPLHGTTHRHRLQALGKESRMLLVALNDSVLKMHVLNSHMCGSGVSHQHVQYSTC